MASFKEKAASENTTTQQKIGMSSIAASFWKVINMEKAMKISMEIAMKEASRMDVDTDKEG